MSILKYILIPIALIAGIYCLLCVFGPKRFDTTRSIEMNAPKNMAFNMVNNMKTWESWSPWFAKDPEIKLGYGDKTIGIGATSTWSSEVKEVGSGKQTIIESVAGELIKTNLEFEGWDDASTGVWNFEDAGNGKSKVSWGMESSKDMPFLLRGMMLVSGMKKSMENDFDSGLASIKKIAEDRAVHKMYDGYKINEVALQDKHFVMNRSEVDIDNIQQYYATNLGALFGKVNNVGVEMDGMPSGLFFKFDEPNNRADMAAAIPVKDAVDIRGVSSLTVPAKRALQIDYYGDYKQTTKAHDAVDKYLADYGLLYDAPIIEEYVTDPSTEPDSKKWLTKITYYLAE